MSIIRTASEKDVQFIGDHEGFVSQAYLCPAGVLTIGYGFTMRSKVFASYWRGKYGRDLRKGDTISRADADILLKKLIDEEYGAAVATKVEPQKQHHFGAATSVAFNCGTGSLSWKWAQSLLGGFISRAASLLRTTAVTANGRRLDGLVKRREDEAKLLEHGVYAHSPTASRSTSAESVKQYQSQLQALGYYHGKVDGIAGKQTEAAVLKFQQDHDLVIDGIVGPATRAALIRALDSKNAGNSASTGGVVAGGGVGVGEAANGSFDLTSIVNIGLTLFLVVGLVTLGFALFQNRGAIFGTNRVPT